MKKILVLILLLSTSLSTFALDPICYESKYVQTRDGIRYLPNEQEPFTGENLCVYSNGQKASEGIFLNGLLTGKWTHWYENGQKESEGEFWNGLFIGKFTRWYANGLKQREFNTNIDGLYDGKFTEWWDNGQKQSEGNWKNGSRIDEWNYWLEDGTLSTNYIY